MCMCACSHCRAQRSYCDGIVEKKKQISLHAYTHTSCLVYLDDSTAERDTRATQHLLVAGRTASLMRRMPTIGSSSPLLRQTIRGYGPVSTVMARGGFVDSYAVSSVGIRHKSALARFMESIREQVKENQEFQQNVKQLQDKSTEISESESMRRAKEAFDKAKVG